jgi:ABC-type glycerol-3-phosphate transport system permease component
MIGMGTKAPRTVARIGIVVLLAMFAVLALYPILYMASASLKTTSEFIRDPLSLPAGLSYHDNYRALWTRFDIPRLFLNTVIYIALSSLLSLAVSLPASFAIAKLRFPFRSVLRFLLIGTLIVPVITYIVPSYVMMARLGFVDSYKSVVLLWAATSVPGNVFLLSSLMRAIPDEILESARLDGAGYFETLTRMVVPLSFPGLITVSIFNVTGWWNDLLVPLIFLQSDRQMTVTVGMATIVGRLTTDYPLLLAGLFTASLPPMAAYILLQRFIRQGLVIGAVK